MSIYSRKTLLSAVTLFVMLAILNLGTGFNTFAATESAKKYSGEEIFGGLYFGQGEVAQLFPEIWDPYQATLKEKGKEFAEMNNSVVSEIKAKNPDFFNRFGEEMQSGDHIKIQAALSSATEQLKEARKSELQKSNNKSFKFNEEKDFTVTVDIAVAVAAVVLLFLVVTAIDFTPVAPVDQGPVGSLQKDELVDHVANRLDFAS